MHWPWSAPMTMLSIGIFLPSLIFFLFSASSGAPGLVAGAVIILVLIGFGVGRMPSIRQGLDALALVAVVLLVLVAHGAIAAYYYSPDLVRTMLSTISLAVVVFAAMLMRDTLFASDQMKVAAATHWIRVLFLVIAMFGILEIQPDLSRSLKPVFPFTEPSHFALAFTPFLIDGCVRTRNWQRVALIATGLGIAFLLQSLSMVVTMVLVIVICLPVIPMVVLCGLVIGAASLLDLQYFTDRLDLTEHTQNLSTLVYIQGWELISDAFRRTDGWGIGFQQLGFAPVQSPTADQIVRLFCTDVNLQDGGFTASKLLSEFGVVGLVLLLLYLYQAGSCIWRLRVHATARSPVPLDAGTILAMSFVAGYAVELFVRGVGYFSGTAMFMVAGLAHTLRSGRAVRQLQWKPDT